MTAGQAAAAVFVDAGLPDLKPEQVVKVANPQPVQLLFEFRTKGVANARATKFVKQQVTDTVKASNLFSDVSETPTPNGAILSVMIDDVVLPQELADAKAQGFATGATLFIAGSTVREHYNCQIDYIGSVNAPKLTRTASHSIIMQLGLINTPPQNAVKVEGGTKAAVMTMVRQIVSNPLNTLASDPAFQPGQPAATPVAAATPAAATATPASPEPAAAAPAPAAPSPVAAAASPATPAPAAAQPAQPQAAPAHP
jgi:hypothetical protein